MEDLATNVKCFKSELKKLQSFRSNFSEMPKKNLRTNLMKNSVDWNYFKGVSKIIEKCRVDLARPKIHLGRPFPYLPADY